MTSLQPIFNKISEEAQKQRYENIRYNSTYEEMKVYIENNSLVKLLSQTNHLFNDENFDNFLCSLDINSLKIDELFEPLGCQALFLTSFLCLPNISLKIIEKLEENKSLNSIGIFTKENYSPISIALLTKEVNPKMEEVVLKMLDFPEYCCLDKVHNINPKTKTYIWQWVCKNGYKNIAEKLYYECLPFFKLDESTDISETTPLCDLIYWDIGKVSALMIKDHREKCMLDKVIQGRTALLYALLKGNKLAAALILCDYDDCCFSYRDPNGLTAFELLITYGYQGIVSDILETRRDLYIKNLSNKKARTPFELALLYKNWDIATTLVTNNYIDYDELINSKVINIPYKQYLVLQNEIELLKFFSYIEDKWEPKTSTEDNNPAWQKIKELGLETIVKDILKDPMAFAKNSKNGVVTINNNDKNMTNKITGLSKIQPKVEPIIEPKKIEKKFKPTIINEKTLKSETINNDSKPEPKKRGRPRKIKPEE
jgi:hypothetical protein